MVGVAHFSVMSYQLFTQKETNMVKLYVIISAVILFVVLFFSPLLSPSSNAAIGAAPSGVQGWMAGPFGAGK
jgi:hypothetical protein